MLPFPQKMQRLGPRTMHRKAEDLELTEIFSKESKAQRLMVRSFAEDPLEAIENHITLEETSPPDPSTLKPTDVIIAVKYAAVGWVDLLMTSGLYQHAPSPPYCPGMEYSGEIVWAGANVDPAVVKVGDPVIADGFLTGPRTSGEYQAYGGFASYTVAPYQAARPLPQSFSLAQGCNFLGNYETAYHCLVACGGLQPGETVLVHGASGSTGLAAVHVAKHIGATVLATGRSDEKLAVVKEQGADHVINTKGSDGVRRFRDDVKALTGGKGVDVVYDGVGGAISLESLRCVTFGARYLIVGWAATPFVAKGKQKKPNPNMLPTNLIMMKGVRVQGCPTVIATQHDPSIRKKRMKDLLKWADSGGIQPFFSDEFPFTEYKTAMQRKWSGQVIGGCILKMP